MPVKLMARKEQEAKFFILFYFIKGRQEFCPAYISKRCFTVLGGTGSSSYEFFFQLSDVKVIN